ncbi:MAG: hypothetical protein J2P17_33375, partial [Mycobacterium sp.]|nr:hypothetical protein [Mycobacterium sp.]
KIPASDEIASAATVATTETGYIGGDIDPPSQNVTAVVSHNTPSLSSLGSSTPQSDIGHLFPGTRARLEKQLFSTVWPALGIPHRPGLEIRS